MSDTEFKVGDAVVLIPSESWIGAARRWATDGRVGRVIHVPTSLSPISRYVVQFETKTKRPPKRESDYRICVCARDICPASTPLERHQP